MGPGRGRWSRLCKLGFVKDLKAKLGFFRVLRPTHKRICTYEWPSHQGPESYLKMNKLANCTDSSSNQNREHYYTMHLWRWNLNSAQVPFIPWLWSNRINNFIIVDHLGSYRLYYTYCWVIAYTSETMLAKCSTENTIMEQIFVHII